MRAHIYDKRTCYIHIYGYIYGTVYESLGLLLFYLCPLNYPRQNWHRILSTAERGPCLFTNRDDDSSEWNGCSNYFFKPMTRNTPFPLMRFKPFFSAVLRIFLSAQGRGCLAEGRFDCGQHGYFTVFTAVYLPFPAVLRGCRIAENSGLNGVSWEVE